MDIPSFFQWPLSFHSIKSDIVIVIIIISVIILAISFKVYTTDSSHWWGLPRQKKGAFFGLIHGAPGISIFIHQSLLKNNPIPLLEPAGIPKDYYFITNYDWKGKHYVGSLPPEIFAKAYQRGYDIEKYTNEQLTDIFKDTLELQKTFHSTPPPTEFGPDFYQRKRTFAKEQLESVLLGL
ncbi:hypothetical protein EB118_18820 [bacterium]|nr:hypothetical protein [Actinomycetota bacterium]NDG32114.1 hypothetical protein [bacterium]